MMSQLKVYPEKGSKSLSHRVVMKAFSGYLYLTCSRCGVVDFGDTISDDKPCRRYNSDNT